MVTTPQLFPILGRLLQRWRAPRISAVPELAQFLERNAWLVAQKSVIGYCAVKTRLPIQELIKDKPFAQAYDVSVWEAFAAALADLVVVTEGYLRPHAVGRESAVLAALGATFESLLEAHPLPVHRPHGWGAEVAALRARLESAAAAAPEPIRRIATTASARIFATLPIHQRLRAADGPAIEANVQFLMVGLAHEFEKRIDWPAIAADILKK